MVRAWIAATGSLRTGPRRGDRSHDLAGAFPGVSSLWEARPTRQFFTHWLVGRPEDGSALSSVDVQAVPPRPGVVRSCRRGEGDDADGSAARVRVAVPRRLPDTGDPEPRREPRA